MVDFLESILWSSLNNSKDNFYRMIILGYLKRQFILVSFFPPTNKDIKKKINICFFIVHDIYISSNQTKFAIDINNDELLETIHRNVRRGGKKLIGTSSVKQHGAQVCK
jgi:hypothetical protein